MIMFGIGEAAAFITAVSWTFSCQAHTMAGRIIGATGVTVARVPLYILPVGLVALVSASHFSLPMESLLFLAGSATMGIFIGDPAFYTSSITVGTRLALLLQSLSSALAAILGLLFLDEHIGFTGATGILIASCGVAFVLMEGGFGAGTDLGQLPRAVVFKGLGLGLLSAFSMASSFFFVKQALIGGVDPVFAAFIRLSIGGTLVWTLAVLRGRFRSTMRQAWSNKTTIRYFLLGAIASLVGNTLMPIAMQYTATGVAATLINLQPVIIIPIVAFVDKKRPSLRAVLGTAIAFAGSAMLFLR